MRQPISSSMPATSRYGTGLRRPRRLPVRLVAAKIRSYASILRCGGRNTCPHSHELLYVRQLSVLVRSLTAGGADAEQLDDVVSGTVSAGNGQLEERDHAVSGRAVRTQVGDVTGNTRVHVKGLQRGKDLIRISGTGVVDSSHDGVVGVGAREGPAVEVMRVRHRFDEELLELSGPLGSCTLKHSGGAEAGEHEAVERLTAGFRALRVIGSVRPDHQLVVTLVAEQRDERGALSAETAEVETIRVEALQVVHLRSEERRVGKGGGEGGGRGGESEESGQSG